MAKAGPGICESCDKQIGKTAMTRHVQSCPERTFKDGEEPYFLISVQGRYSKEYWLVLEASASVTLTKLDHSLRDTWLECCGHMSDFTIGQQTYSSHPEKDYGEKSMRTKLGDVLSPGLTFQHEYDMGSTTTLVLKVVGERFGVKRASPAVELLARNVAPAVTCTECGNTEAVNLCAECQYTESGWLCEACSGVHECGEEMLLPMVNSPRVGVCGYMG